MLLCRAGPWLAEFVDLRDRLNLGEDMEYTAAGMRALTLEVVRRIERIQASGRDHPVPALNPRSVTVYVQIFRYDGFCSDMVRSILKLHSVLRAVLPCEAVLMLCILCPRLRRKLAALEAQAALEAAIAEQQREEEGLRSLEAHGAPAALEAELVGQP